MLSKSKNFYRRQDFDLKSYFINGSIYIIHRDLIIKKKLSIKKQMLFYICLKVDHLKLMI